MILSDLYFQYLNTFFYMDKTKSSRNVYMVVKLKNRERKARNRNETGETHDINELWLVLPDTVIC